MQFADRLLPLQANVFHQMDAAKHQARQAGREIIDLSIGSSDLSPPTEALQVIKTSLEDAQTHGYTLFQGTRDFRQACAQWYERKFGLGVDADTEVLPLIGSQEGTAIAPLALLNPGDGAFLTDPCYPSHLGGVSLANGRVFRLPLRAEQAFLPMLAQIPESQRQQAKIMVLSYPHNPTSATAPLSFWEEALAFCTAHDLVLVHDFPYVDWVFEGEAAVSVLQVDRQKQRSVECFSMSKSFHMGGFRVGFAIGNAQILQAMGQVRAVLNFNQNLAILRGATAALQGSEDFVSQALQIYRQRRDVCVQALQEIGWQVPTPKATMYLWMPLPPGFSGSAVEFCVKLVRDTGVALAPGSGFGAEGEGYVRLALVRDELILKTAVEFMGSFLSKTISSDMSRH
ncbi:MAG: LL-diaminopimelate aminotransferase [Synechococcaceae cyanobacterium SM2_3_1]|nr:LL-diaminopimelate aminotransferase [Synechococcaceae cyanobacterium SM2_3_1]